MTLPLAIDIEASGLGPRSFPLEIALADPAGDTVRSWLIRPAPDWLTAGEWDPAAEATHGLSRDLVDRDGAPADQVAAELVTAIGGRVLISEAPELDQGWLARLWEAGRALRPLPAIEDAHQVLHFLAVLRRRDARAALDAAEVEFGRPHRAGPDAARLAMAVRLVLSAADPI